MVRRLGGSLVLIALLATAAGAQEKRRTWVTLLGRETLSRSHFGVLAKIERSVQVPGRRLGVLSLKVQDVLWGDLGVKEFNAVLPDPPPVDLAGKRVVVFLSVLRNSMRAVNLFYLEGREGAGKLNVLRQHLAIEKAPPAERLPRLRQQILAGLQARPEWAFKLHLRELYGHCAVRRKRLDGRFRRALNRLAFTLTDADRQIQLRQLLVQLAGQPTTTAAPRAARPDPATAGPTAAEAEIAVSPGEALARLERATDDDGRIEAIGALAGWPGAEVETALVGRLESPSAAIRRAAAFVLGELRRPSAGKPLISRLLRETDGAVRVALIRALGRCRVTDAVDLLIAETAHAARGGEAMLALARIGERRGLEALRAIRAGTRQPKASKARRRLAAWYLSAAFRALEARGGRATPKGR